MQKNNPSLTTDSRSYLQPFWEELVAAERALDAAQDAMRLPMFPFDAARHARELRALRESAERVSGARSRYESAAARETALKGNESK